MLHSLLYSFTKTKHKIKNLYQILQLTPNASLTDIKHNYLKLAKIYHPDVYKGNDPQRFSKIQQAYQTLKSYQKRKKYDLQNGFIKQQKQNINQTISQQNKQQTFQQSNPNKVNLDYSFDKTQTILNIDQEYQKFFGKKIKTEFQEIRIFQQPEFKQMNEQERIRRKFKQIHNEPFYTYKTSHQQDFKTILNSQINQRNENLKQEMDEKKRYQYKLTEEYKKKSLRRLYICSFVIGLIFFPLLISLVTRWRQQRQQQLSIQIGVENYNQQKQMELIRQRIKF